MSEQQNHPELHVNEEPRNDLMDVGVGFLGMFGVCLAFGLVATVISLLIK